MKGEINFICQSPYFRLILTRDSENFHISFCIHCVIFEVSCHLEEIMVLVK